MAKKLTITDIAQIAGVSKATVSRVMNHKPDVDAETRSRIWQIIEEHGYTPNLFATVQAGGRSRLVGVLVPSLTWPLVPEVMRGVAEVIEASDYELVLYGLVHQETRGDQVERVVSARLTSGLLAVMPGPAIARVTALYEQGFPVVVIDDQGLPTAAPWVGADNFTGAREATRHLLHQGHTRIAHIKGPDHYQCSHDRYDGYLAALREAGLIHDPALVVQGDFEIPSGRVAAQVLLDQPEPPTAIFAGNDLMAYGVVNVAEARGLAIPSDLALVGFDDTSPSAFLRPPLTTVRQPFYEMGRQGMDLLLSLIETPQPIAAQIPGVRRPLRHVDAPRVTLETSLVIRESSGHA